MNRKDRHFKYRPQRKMKLNQLFVLCFFLFVIFDGTTSQFFGRNTRRKQQPQRVNPSNNQCYYDNQCSTGKCRQLDNIFCGFGSEYIRDLFTYSPSQSAPTIHKNWAPCFLQKNRLKKTGSFFIQKEKRPGCLFSF